MMAHRDSLKDAMERFVEAFASKDSKFDGDWIFGHVIESLDKQRIDLLDEATPQAGGQLLMVVKLAINKFEEELATASIPIEALETASVTLSRGEVAVKLFYDISSGSIVSEIVTGYDMTIVATAEVQGEPSQTVESTVFVADFKKIRKFRDAIKGPPPAKYPGKIEQTCSSGHEWKLSAFTTWGKKFELDLSSPKSYPIRHCIHCNLEQVCFNGSWYAQHEFNEKTASESASKTWPIVILVIALVWALPRACMG